MADIVKLLALVNGAPESIELPANTGVWLSIKVGGGVSNTELTKAILDNLITLQNGSDIAASLHHHDGRYFTETELGASTNPSGASKIGVFLTATNYTAATQDVEAHLTGINTALGAVAGNNSFNDNLFNLYNNADNTKIMKFSVANVDAFATRILTMANFDTDLGALVNANISASAAIAYSKLNLANSVVNADIATGAAIAYAKLNLANSIVDADVAAGAAIAVNKLAALTAGRAVITDGSGFLTVSPVTSATLAFMDATSSVQTQLNARELSANKGIAGGYASLDGGGKVPLSQLPSSIMTYEGVWNAATNSPTLADGVGDTGMTYRVGVSGTQDLGSGPISFTAGDYVIYNGTIWEKSDGTDAVTSVNGFAGVVVLTTSDIAEGTNQYFTVERAQDAVGSAFLATTTITLSYDDLNNQITADVNSASITNTHISASAAIAYSKLALTASIVNADISASAAIAYSKLNLANSIAAADLTTGVADQSTITGGNGTPLAAAAVPLVRKPMVAGESFAAGVSFFVRFAMTGETAGRVYKADKDASSVNKYNAIGIALSVAGASAGDTIQVTILGTHVLGANDSAFAGADVNKELFVGTSGAFILGTALSGATGEAAFCAGCIEGTDRIWVDFKQLRGIS